MPTSGQDITNELQNTIAEMNKCIKALGKLTRNAAESERVYRVGLAKEILILKDGGYPATLIPDLARGNVGVAKLKLDRDIAEGLERANIEYINALKVRIRVLEGFMSKEWSARE